MSPEVTWDSQAGSAFESHNGQALEPTTQEALAPQYETAEAMQPEAYSMEADPELIAIDQAAPVFEEQQPEEEVGLNPVQEQAANSWKQAGLDPEAAMQWADSEESPLSEDTYNRVGELLNDENPEVVQLSMGLLGLAHRSTEFFNLESEKLIILV